ncbi:MAG: hypothetical protein JWM88_879 [Verrucomicrobia bacterium]|nr:hypothetical protein [Verrucomicrobiota bacterium]
MNVPSSCAVPPAQPNCLCLSQGGLKAVLLFCLSVCFLSSARAQLYTETSTLFGDPSQSEYFGYTVAASGDTIAVGTSANKRVYVFVRTGAGWTLQQKLTVNYSNYSAGTLALDGDTLVAGGVIYARSGGTWTLVDTLPFLDPSEAVRGDTLAIGNPYNPADNSASRDGVVVVYVRNGSRWTAQATLRTDTTGQQEQMGTNVVLDGDTLVAGLRQGTGGAYVFVRNGTTWTRQARLVTPTGTGWMRVALEGDTAAVSDPLNNHIYIFNRSGTTWTLAQTLSLPAGGGNYLGDELAMNGGILAAGAENMFYLYSKTAGGWALVQSIARSNYSFAALALANRGKLFVLSNPFDNTNGSANGIVEAFSVPPPRAPGSGWLDVDVGAVGRAGRSVLNGSEVQVSGSGTDIWENSDQFHFRTESLTGDGAIVARVTSAGTTHPWAKAGVMFREDVAPGSRAVMALVTPGSHLGTMVRDASAANATFQDAGWIGAPIWLMLARSGNLFASYRSDDGNNWTPMGSTTVIMPATVHLGLAVSSHDNAALNTATFSGVELVGVPPPPGQLTPPSNLTASLNNGTNVRLQWTDNSAIESGFSIERATGGGPDGFVVIKSVDANTTEFTDVITQENTTYTYQVRAEHFDDPRSAPSNSVTITTTTRPPAALSGADLGAVAVAGSFTQSNDILSIDAAGADIWNNEDSGYFVNRAITGDFDLQFRVLSISPTHPWAKAGVMVRESLDARARNVFTLVTSDNVAGMQVRDTFGGTTNFSAGPWVRAPYWARLKRTGNNFEAFISPDRGVWQSVGSANLPLSATVRAGVAVSSHVSNTTTHANVQIGN